MGDVDLTPFNGAVAAVVGALVAIYTAVIGPVLLTLRSQVGDFQRRLEVCKEEHAIVSTQLAVLKERLRHLDSSPGDDTDHGFDNERDRGGEGG